IDVSSGGLLAGVTIPAGPGYQTVFSERIKRATSVPTGTVGFITDLAQADHIIRTCQVDLVFVARDTLRDPYWALHAAARLGAKVSWPAQYLRAAPSGTSRRENPGYPEKKLKVY